MKVNWYVKGIASVTVRVSLLPPLCSFPACLTLREVGGNMENSCLSQTLIILLNPNSLVWEDAAILVCLKSKEWAVNCKEVLSRPWGKRSSDCYDSIPSMDCWKQYFFWHFEDAESPYAASICSWTTFYHLFCEEVGPKLTKSTCTHE